MMLTDKSLLNDRAKISVLHKYLLYIIYTYFFAYKSYN